MVLTIASMVITILTEEGDCKLSEWNAPPSDAATAHGTVCSEFRVVGIGSSARASHRRKSMSHMGSSPNSGPFQGPVKGCRNILGTPKGTLI